MKKKSSLRLNFIVVILVLMLAVPIATKAVTSFNNFWSDEVVIGASHLRSAQTLLTERVGSGEVVLYSYESGHTGLDGYTCVSADYVMWGKAQVSSNAGCWKHQPNNAEFVATYSVGGNVRTLSIAFGLATAGGETVRVIWSDNHVHTAPVQNGYFLLTRDESVPPARIELLDTDKNVIHFRAFPNANG